MVLEGGRRTGLQITKILMDFLKITEIPNKFFLNYKTEVFKAPKIIFNDNFTDFKVTFFLLTLIELG